MVTVSNNQDDYKDKKGIFSGNPIWQVCRNLPHIFFTVGKVE